MIWINLPLRTLVYCRQPEEDLYMFKLFEPKCQECGEIGQPVRLNQTEEECRAQHGCQQAFCPLRSDLKPTKLDDAIMRNRRA